MRYAVWGLALLAVAAAKDDGFDYISEEEAISSLANWQTIGPEWAEKVYKQAFLYDEPWSQQDLGVIANNKMINTKQPGQVPRFTNVGFKKTAIPKGLFNQCKK
jgi:hypothetical protein